MCEEKSTKEIADMVDLSPRTVEAIRDKLKVKTGAKSTAGLILYAVKNNILKTMIIIPSKSRHLRVLSPPLRYL